MTEPCTLVIFGATGNLARGKLLPALYHLEVAGLLHELTGWHRVVIEKPFGRDRDSAGLLQAQIAQQLDEHQIYRIDHYMGKAMVQNVLVTRFANVMLEPRQ